MPDRSRALRALAAPAATIFVLLGLWQGCQIAGLLPMTVPAPSQIAAAFGQSHGDLLYHMAPTVFSAATGLATALLIALGLAGLAHAFPPIRATVARAGVLVDCMPLIALTPILMVWVGNGLAPRIVIATIAALFPLLTGAMQGFAAVDRNRAALFHVLAASRWHTLTKLAWPSARPFLFAAVKIAAPLALLGALIAEWVSAERGLGIMMIYALFSFNVPLAWLTIATVSLLAACAYGIVALVEYLLGGDAHA